MKNKFKKRPINNNTRILEITAVFLTGFGKFVFMDLLDLRLLYISSACLFWIGYITYRSRKGKGIIDYWGLNFTRFNRTFLELLPFAIVLVIAFFLIGNYLKTNVLNWSILPVLLIYPIWGIIQQFIIVGLLARNLKDLKNINTPEWLIILITAIIFAIVHYPHYLLIIGTFLLALVYTKLYLNGRNLIVLGIYHGWVGAFFFYTILGRDAWLEVFGHLPG